MGARVRVDRRTNRLYLDLYWSTHRRRVFTHLPATPVNQRTLQTKAEALDREMFLGIFDPAKHFPDLVRSETRTFRELASEWLEKKRTEVSPLTLKWYREHVDGKLLPFWGSRDLRHVSPALVDQFRARLKDQQLAPRSMNIALKILRDLFRLAYGRGYLPDDRSRWIALQKERRSEILPFSFEEKDALLKALPLRWRPYFVVAFGTGLRPSEQIALKRDAIDWARNRLHVREGWRHGQATELKTVASHREVHILPPIRRALEEQRLIAGGSALVFPNRSGGHINVNNLRRRIWYPALRKAGLTSRDLYNTRHTFATHALASGEDPGWVAQMLGHTNLLMLTTRYYRYVPNLTRKDGSLLARRLG